MRERPILFSAPMVRAILAGTKTQTRRVVKPQPDVVYGMSFGTRVAPFQMRFGNDTYEMRCPYGQPGDRLWVREAWRDWSDSAWHYAADGLVLPKQRDRELAAMLAQKAPFTWESYKWRPSIHMPRAASRITLEVTGVRVERLRDISEADAKAEGAPLHNSPAATLTCHRLGFRDLWKTINGPDSWDANPWVWVISFKRVTT